jgi:hypothetical protein
MVMKSIIRLESPPRRETGHIGTSAVFWPSSSLPCRNIAGESRDILTVAGDSRPQEGCPAMTPSTGAAGFNRRPAPIASPRLADAVAATLAVGSLSLCLIVTLAFSIKLAMAMPLPA